MELVYQQPDLVFNEGVYSAFLKFGVKINNKTHWMPNHSQEPN